jgi:hypothetical protein
MTDCPSTIWLAAEQQRRAKPVVISYNELAESMGVSRSSAQAAIAWLIQRRLLGVTRTSVTATPCYSIRTPWKIDYRRSQGTR